MNGKKTNSKKRRICVLHGAIRNAGDFLIYDRGKKLLGKYLGAEFDFIYKPRFKEIPENDYDGIIILGGPLITRSLHPQSRNIMKFIEKRDTPIICLGLGISREKFNSYNSYFKDAFSINFWKRIYESSKLFSVRDIETYKVLKTYQINSELTGCPALFYPRKNEMKKSKKGFDNILISIPQIHFYDIKYFLLTIYFISSVRYTFDKKELGIAFQHGYNTFPLRILKYLSSIFNAKTYDLSNRSIEDSKEVSDYDIHLGTRLHLHIYFLSMNKPSILLSVDMRTRAFINTINTLHNSFSFFGVKKVIAILGKDEENILEYFYNAFKQIDKFEYTITEFLSNISFFIGKISKKKESVK